MSGGRLRAGPEARAPAGDGRHGGPGGGSVWIDLQDPDDQAFQAAVAPLVKGDGRAAGMPGPSARPRLIVHDGYVRLRFATPDGRPLAVYLGEERVVTVHPGPLPEVEDVRRRYEEERHDGAASPADLALYRALDRVLNGFERAVDRLVGRVEALNLDPRSLHDTAVLHEVIALRRQAIDLRRHIDPTVDLFGLLDGRDFPFVRPEHRAFFEDLHERVRSMAADVDQTRDLLAEDIEAFTSVQSQHVNKIMKVFTILQAVFLPPTLIASIYGMNFQIPELHWRFGYAYSLALMVVTVAVLLLYVRYRRWLG